MEPTNAQAFFAVFHDLPDPRTGNATVHPFASIFALAVCGVLAGAEHWTQIEDFGLANEAWFKTFLDLPHGIPSHDTFGRVFSLLDPDAMEKLFLVWAAALSEPVEGRVIAIDGKTLRHSFDRAAKRSAIHMISAWLDHQSLVLGQLATDEKSNEITAIPRLLKLLNIKKAIVTIDAMGCQRKIAQQIIEQGGDYVLSLKDNQPEMLQAVRDLFVPHPEAPASPKELLDQSRSRQSASQMNKGHGRIENRELTASTELNDHLDWPGLGQVFEIKRTQTREGKTSHETAYGLTSLTPKKATALRLLECVREHWGVENKLHWCLDVQDREDQSRARVRNAAENLSRLRRLTMNLLKSETTNKRGIHSKRLMCGWDVEYRLKVLGLGVPKIHMQ